MRKKTTIFQKLSSTVSVLPSATASASLGAVSHSLGMGSAGANEVARGPNQQSVTINIDLSGAGLSPSGFLDFRGLVLTFPLF